jgi:bifunctional oligoribonuclease and PAP phosphatase NrnA
MVLDTHRRDRIGRLSALLENPKMLSVCIDHHLPTEIFTPYTVIDSQACCVGAMIHTLYKEMGHELDLAAATGIYTSIICDTGRFSYSSTSRKAHKIADECMKLGVDPDVMHSKLFQHVSLAEIKMFAKALQRMETHLQDRVVIQQIYREDCDKMIDIEHIDLEYIHEFNKSIEDVKCVVLLRELPHNQVRVSLRSTSNIDVGKPMRKMGGGGHCKAAGATFHGSLEEAKKQVLELLSETLC